MIAVIDTNTSSPTFNQQIETIITDGGGLHHVTIIPGGNIGFIASHDSDEMIIIDTDPDSPTFHTQIGSVKVGYSPVGVVFQPLPMAVAYVSNGNDNTISVIGVMPNMCEGDFNRDGDVDGSDLALLAENFGRTDCEAEALGTWVGEEENGDPGNWVSVFSCNNLDIVGPQELYRGTFSLDKNVSPYQINFFITASHDTNNAGKTSLGIYQVVGDIITLTFGAPGDTTRPSSFISTAESRVLVLSK